ncbi:hypothetical protein P691DRAFT_303776 [Macrolepiota fuliginosa MF-IS2]|uniref:BTB domain-containing protein n=1 Tax=Macrolepiota fuliginosa MF-IS2 TaxID=1400762 RepID=A0A9P5X7P3_9AGAR|nr:hypothetical protein P691DRAFT_303776 [Macrolepiota fuliginosa MF-IS2]
MSTPSRTPRLTIMAPEPFDHPDADVILRSSDKEPVDFRVFKLFLSLASPFFAMIFTLPQPNSPIYAEEYEDGVPVVQMSEDKRTLHLLLKFCYPIALLDIPRLSSLQELQSIAQAAFKFEMDGVKNFAKKTLVEPRFVESQPLRVFAIACRFGWVPEAKIAARYTLRQPMMSSSYFEELTHITAAAYHRLQQYHRVCGEVAASRVKMQPALAEFDDEWVWVTCQKCPGTGVRARRDTGYPESRRWFVQWVQDVAVELQQRPWGVSAKKFDLRERAVSNAQRCCSTCGPRAAGDLETFSEILAVEIEKELASIEIDINFNDSTWD